MTVSRMKIRSVRERVLQTALFEIVGVAVFTPLVWLFMGDSVGESIGLLIALSLAAVTVTGLFNHSFDWIEHKKTGRLASDRPQKWRVIHAVMLECCIAVATMPIIKFTMDVSWLEALVADAVLLVLYAGYGYVFHVIYDRYRPVQEPERLVDSRDGQIRAAECVESS